MKKYGCYFRAVGLSILAALLIDGVINFEDYKEGWTAATKKKQEEKTGYTSSKLPAQIGKVGATAFLILFGTAD